MGGGLAQRMAGPWLLGRDMVGGDAAMGGGGIHVVGMTGVCWCLWEDWGGGKEVTWLLQCLTWAHRPILVLRDWNCSSGCIN